MRACSRPPRHAVCASGAPSLAQRVRERLAAAPPCRRAPLLPAPARLDAACGAAPCYSPRLAGPAAPAPSHADLRMCWVRVPRPPHAHARPLGRAPASGGALPHMAGTRLRHCVSLHTRGQECVQDPIPSSRGRVDERGTCKARLTQGGLSAGCHAGDLPARRRTVRTPGVREAGRAPRRGGQNAALAQRGARVHRLGSVTSRAR